MDRTSSQKTDGEQEGTRARKGDEVAQLLRIQQESIRRTTRFWIECGLRLQRGDLGIGSWLEFETEYCRDTLEYVRKATELLPLQPRSSKDSGGQSR